MISTAAILAGIAAAGFVLDIKGFIGQMPLNRATVSMLVIGVSVAGVIMSFGVARFGAAAPAAKFPWKGPVETLKVLYNTQFDPLLAIAIAANAFFWFIGALEVLVLNQLGISQFKFSNSLTSGLVVAEFIGIAVGGLLSIYFTKKIKWYRLLVPVVGLMGLCMILAAVVPYLSGSAQFIYLFAVLAVMGVSGGLYAIPLEAFIQVRPAADCKGATIAAANFAAFSGVLISGPVLNLFNALNITPSNDLAVMGAMTLITAILLFVFLRGSKE
jgi:acyl-[acyl-carrier-protein]-phospholipid O-acyltransferase/long-chain-fatty-acid--[acyl-carrier-protein] ligase